MDNQAAPCLECGSAVSATSIACPDCGYAVARHDRWRLLLGGLGTAMSLSVVFAPVGLPLLWRAHRHWTAAEGTVTRRREPSLRDHLQTILRQYLGRSG